MQIEILGCHGGETPECRLTSLLVNGTVALDAGCLSQALPLERQAEIRSVLLTHAHFDHTGSLPFFLDNVFGRYDDGLEVCASSATVYAVRKNLFNASIWPDFSRLPDHLLPALRFRELEDEVPIERGGVRFTPIPVNHAVPTYGFLLEDDEGAVLWSSDTGPTHRIWEVANATPGLRAVCIEVSFDDSLQQLADESCHLTPSTLARELEKLAAPVPVYLHHVKPAREARIREEVAALDYEPIEFLEQGRCYDFGAPVQMRGGATA